MRNLNLTGLEDLAKPETVSSGAPLELPLADVIEDPNQPRVQFDEAALDELSASIKAAKRVKHPISVKPANADDLAAKILWAKNHFQLISPKIFYSLGF